MRHPLTLLTNEVQQIDVTSSNTVLLLQDIHAPFTDQKCGYMAIESARKILSREFDEYFEMLEVVEPNFARLVAAADEADIPCVFSCLGFVPPDKPSAFQRATGWIWDLSGSAGQLPVTIVPLVQGNPTVFSKSGWGALGNPVLRSLLSERRIETILLAGTMLEFGIQQTANQLQDAGYGVLIISDGVVGLTRSGAEHCSSSYLHGLIKARSTEETLDLLARLNDEGLVRV